MVNILLDSGTIFADCGGLVTGLCVHWIYMGELRWLWRKKLACYGLPRS